MKSKITLLGLCLMFFMSSSIYAQYDVLDFESAAGGTGLSWTEDANGSGASPYTAFVANPVSGGINTSATVAQFDAQVGGNTYALVYAGIDDFEFDATNTTVTIKVYKTKVSNIAIKFEGGGGVFSEITAANTMTDVWEEVTFDFSGSMGDGNVYNKLVIIPDFEARAATNTLYFDDVQIPTGNYTAPVVPEPMVSAPTPTCPSGDVISLFSDAYTNVMVDTWRTVWSSGNLTSPDFSIGGNDIKHYTSVSFVGVETTTNTVDATSMTHFHLDLWTGDATEFKIKLVDFGAGNAFGGGDDTEKELVYSCFNQNEWVSFEIPLSDFTGMNTGNIAQYIYSASSPGGGPALFIDNVYFSSCGTPVPVPAIMPAIAASTPVIPAGMVISLFSDPYTDVTVDTWQTVWSGVGSNAVVPVAGNDARNYTDLTFVGIETTGANSIDASSMTYFNFEFWSTNMRSFKIKLVDFGVDNAFGGGDDTESELTYSCVEQGKWVKFSIPMVEFTGLNNTNISQYIITATDNAGSADFFIDNVMFSTMPLPVELTYFNAKVEGNTNVLSWETATEENNSHFDVERSVDGKNFELIGAVEGNGTSFEVMNYSFVDENPSVSAYYRLRQIDFDGGFEYSDILNVNRRQIASNDVKLYPNPTKDNLTVDFTASTDEEMLITVTDITGRVLISLNRNVFEGSNQLYINLNELPQGNYFVRLQSNTNTVVKSIIKQ